MDSNSLQKQIRLLYQLKQSIKQNDNKYEELVTDAGIIYIPTKTVIKAIHSSVEHYKSKIQELNNENINTNT